MSARTWRAGTLLLALLWSCPVSAQDATAEVEGEPAETSASATPAEEVLEAVERGALIEANRRLDGALRAPSLSREALAELMALRALLAYADERLGLLEESLAGVVALTEADWRFDAFPPPIRARLREIRADDAALALSAELASEVVEGRRRGRVVPEVRDDRGRLVRDVRVFAAVGPAALRLLEDDAELDLGDPHRPVVVRYALEGVGLGGATVARLGSARSPLELALAALPVDDTFLHVTLVTIASVLAAGALAFGFAWVLTDEFTQGQSTQVDVRCCDAP